MSVTGATQEPLLSLKRVTAAYDDGEPVLLDVSLDVFPGQFWALVGTNGSGKSSLAKTLIGMLRPMSGEVLLKGRDVSRIPTKELARHVAYVFQNPEHQFVTDTAWSEIQFSLREAGIPQQERVQKGREVLERFGLTLHAAANPFALSGGEKRRLAVAVMLVSGAPLLVLDEPTFGQDRRHAMELMETIARLHAQGMAVLMLTHDMDLVDAYAERVAVLHEGKIVYSGSVSELWSRRADLFRWGLELPRSVTENEGVSSQDRLEVESFVEAD